MKKIAISTTSFAKFDVAPLEECRNAGYEILCNPHGRKVTTEEILDLARDAQGLIAGTELLTRDVIKKLSTLKVISRCGTGLDNVDREAAKEFGIKVFNTPDAPTQAVAELTIGLMLSCLRFISQADRCIRSGQWQKPMGKLLQSKTVGIIGYGRIGRAVSRLVAAFGADVLAFDIADVSGEGSAKMVDFDFLIASSDIITLHMPPSTSKKAVITDKVISKMKQGTCLINASRGGLVDEEALYEALRSNKLGCAALDVFEKEPYKGNLTKCDNIVLTTHIGSYARESRILMEKQAVANLLKGLEVNK